MGVKINRLLFSIIVVMLMTGTIAYGITADINPQYNGPEQATYQTSEMKIKESDIMHRELSLEYIEEAINYGKAYRDSSYLLFARDWNTQEGGGIAYDDNKAYAICKTPYFVLAEAARNAAREGREIDAEEVSSLLQASKNRLVFMVKIYGKEINFFGQGNYKAAIRQGDAVVYASSCDIAVLGKAGSSSSYSGGSNIVYDASHNIYKGGGVLEFDSSGLDYSRNFNLTLIPIDGSSLDFPIYVSRIH